MIVRIYRGENGDKLESIHLTEIQQIKLEKLLKYPEMLDFIQVLIDGALKYEDENWLKPEGSTMSHRANCDSSFHHLAKKYAGEVEDSDSCLDHDLHIACRALMSYTRKKRKIYSEKDVFTLPPSKFTRSPKLDDSNCTDINNALKKYRGSQYSAPDEDE